MAIKLTEWRLKLNDGVGSVLSKLNSAADKTGSKLEGVQNRLNSGKFQAFTNEIPQAGRAMDLFSSRYALAGAGIAATGALMYKGSELALDYERSMAKINATAQLTPAALSELKNELIDIGENSGGNFMRIPDAFEKINSQVNNVNRSLEILKIANQGAKAGFVDIDLAAGALAQTLSIVGNRDSAGGIMDMLLKSKAVGAGEFADFATYLPQLIASGDNLSIGHRDISGLFSYMTAKGQSASDSAMLLQNAITAMGKSDIQQGFAKQGVRLFDKDGNIRDLGVFFTELQSKLKRFSAEGKSNFLESVGLKDAQAKNAFSVLAGDADKLRSIMDDVRNSAGELNRQLEVTENKTRSWSEIGDRIKSGMMGLGDYILPIVDKIIKGAEAWADYSGGKTQTQKLLKLQADEKLSDKFAMDKVREKFPEYKNSSDWIFRDKGSHLTKAAEQEFMYQKNFDMAKLAGRFGGDYDKFLKDEREKLNTAKPKSDAEKKESFKVTKTGKGKNVTEGINNINQGGQRIINIQFGKLNENIIIQPQTLKEGTTEVTMDLEEMLVRAISGAEESVANE
jgi:hypothetical protein